MCVDSESSTGYLFAAITESHQKECIYTQIPCIKYILTQDDSR